VFDTDGLDEAELSALRAVCLIVLDDKEGEERLLNLYDRYGEGDEYLLSLMMRLAKALEMCTKQEVMSEFARLSKIRALRRNN
jgi:hypothetical protein